MLAFLVGLFVTSLFATVLLGAVCTGNLFVILWAAITMYPFIVGSAVETYKRGKELLR